MKHCNKCDRDLPVSCFHKDKTNKDGLNRWCKECKRTARFKNCEEPYVYLKRRWDNMAKIDSRRKTQRRDRDITYEELIHLYEIFKTSNVVKGLDPLACAYTQETMTFIQGKGHVKTNLSVDRIFNDKPYTKDNITFCTQKFNHLKGSITLDAFKKIYRVMKERGIQHEME